MEKDPRTRSNIPRRSPRGGGRAPEPARESEQRVYGYIYYQVHYAPIPGARKIHFNAIRPKLTERLQDMVRRGQLLICGGYPMSIGGMWLLKVKSRSEAERLIQDNPAVTANLVTFRLVELQEPMGAVVREDHSTEETT
jgi:uncharacterized protein YciI